MFVSATAVWNHRNTFTLCSENVFHWLVTYQPQASPGLTEQFQFFLMPWTRCFIAVQPKHSLRCWTCSASQSVAALWPCSASPLCVCLRLLTQLLVSVIVPCPPHFSMSPCPDAQSPSPGSALTWAAIKTGEPKFFWQSISRSSSAYAWCSRYRDQTLIESDSVSTRGGIIHPSRVKVAPSLHSHSIMYWLGSCNGIFYTYKQAPNVRYFFESLRRVLCGALTEWLKMNSGWKRRRHYLPCCFQWALCRMNQKLDSRPLPGQCTPSV